MSIYQYHRNDYNTYCTVQDFNYAKKGAPDSNLETEEEEAAAPGGQAAAVNRTGSLYEELLLDLRAGDMCHRPQGHSCGP